MGALLQWRRTALLIDDYRTANRVRDTADAMGARPLTPDAARSYALIVTAIERTRRARHLHRAQCLER